MCHAQHLATNSQSQGHNFVSNFAVKLTITQCGHVAYQIKGNQTYSIMQVNILPLHTPTTPWDGSKGATRLLFLK